MKRLILFLLLLSSIAFAQPTDWFSAQTVKTELNISGTIDLVPKGPNPLIEELQADILFLPQNSPTLALRKLETTPPAITRDDRIRYEWKRPPLGALAFFYTSIVETSNSPSLVLSTIPWPTNF